MGCSNVRTRLLAVIRVATHPWNFAPIGEEPDFAGLFTRLRRRDYCLNYFIQSSEL
jgi:hypothetical protein